MFSHLLWFSLKIDKYNRKNLTHLQKRLIIWVSRYTTPHPLQGLGTFLKTWVSCTAPLSICFINVFLIVGNVISCSTCDRGKIHDYVIIGKFFHLYNTGLFLLYYTIMFFKKRYSFCNLGVSKVKRKTCFLKWIWVSFSFLSIFHVVRKKYM